MPDLMSLLRRPGPASQATPGVAGQDRPAWAAMTGLAGPAAGEYSALAPHDVEILGALSRDREGPELPDLGGTRPAGPGLGPSFPGTAPRESVEVPTFPELPSRASPAHPEFPGPPTRPTLSTPELPEVPRRQDVPAHALPAPGRPNPPGLQAFPEVPRRVARPVTTGGPLPEVGRGLGSPGHDFPEVPHRPGPAAAPDFPDLGTAKAVLPPPPPGPPGAGASSPQDLLGMMRQVMGGVDRAVSALQSLSRGGGQPAEFPGSQFEPGAQIFTWKAPDLGVAETPASPSLRR